MATFREAEQARLSVKMKLSNYSWYKYSTVLGDNDGYNVVVTVSNINNHIRKIIPPIVDGVSIKTELE